MFVSLVLIVLIVGLMLWRNEVVYSTRIALIEWDLDKYRKMPGYSRMLYHPKYFRYWTSKSFVQAMQQEYKNNA